LGCVDRIIVQNRVTRKGARRRSQPVDRLREFAERPGQGALSPAVAREAARRLGRVAGWRTAVES